MTPDKERIRQLEAKIEKLRKESLQYAGNEDDGYGGKTRPVTWKEAYQEQLSYESWAMKEMKNACDFIKSRPDCPLSSYPSPYERAIVAGCQRAVKDLQSALEVCKEALNKILEAAQPYDGESITTSFIVKKAFEALNHEAVKRMKP